MKIFDFKEDRGGDTYIEIMPLFFRIQHLLLIILVVILSLTGLSIFFHRTGIARMLVKMEGGFMMRGLLHRAAAVCFMFLLAYHIFYILFTREGKREFARLKLRRKDFTDLVQIIKFDLAMSDEYPELGRYSYREKFQYWGVGAGLIIMVFTGFILWFETASMRALPRWILDITVIVHGFEGLIVFIILLFWHLYNVHLSPGNFPINSTWITGKTDGAKYRKKRPNYFIEGEGEEGK